MTTASPRLAVICALLLGACGGGGGGDGGDVVATAPNAPEPDVFLDGSEGGSAPPSSAIDEPDGTNTTDALPDTTPTDPITTDPSTTGTTGTPDGSDTTGSTGGTDTTSSPEGSGTAGTPEGTDATATSGDTDTADTASALSPRSQTAGYAVVLENFWNAADFPQGFPVDAHLSLIGGATHNVSVSFWEPGGVASEGVEDLAERGEIDLFLVEDVVPAIAAGLADSTIAVREYTDPQVDGVPGRLTFDLALQRDFPRVTLLTMLGPSPDWFVGVDGEPLLVDGEWLQSLSVDLPLLDGGSKSNLTPVMHGPGIHPNDPIHTIAYDVATGTYLPRAAPQVIARLTFTRTR